MGKATRSVSEDERCIAVSIRVPRALLEQVQAYARQTGVSRSKAIVLALELMMKNPPAPLARKKMPKA